MKKLRHDKFFEMDEKLWQIWRIIDEIGDIDFSIADKTKINPHLLSAKESIYNVFKVSVEQTKPRSNDVKAEQGIRRS